MSSSSSSSSSNSSSSVSSSSSSTSGGSGTCLFQYDGFTWSIYKNNCNAGYAASSPGSGSAWPGEIWAGTCVPRLIEGNQKLKPVIQKEEAKKKGDAKAGKAKNKKSARRSNKK